MEHTSLTFVETGRQAIYKDTGIPIVSYTKYETLRSMIIKAYNHIAHTHLYFYRRFPIILVVSCCLREQLTA